MAENMNGFWNSIWIFFEWEDVLFFLYTILLGCIFCFLNNPIRKKASWLLFILFSICLHYTGQYAHIYTYHKDRPFADFGFNTFTRQKRSIIYGVDYKSNVELTSILHSPIFIIFDGIQHKHETNHQHKLTKKELEECKSYINTNNSNSKVSSDGIIIILVESLENWVVRNDIMPELTKLTNHNNVLYAEKIKTQTIGAESADGQMIINTGILPIKEGATCFRFPYNHFPAIMHNAYSQSITLLPHEIDVWNQGMMSPAYGYDSTIVCSNKDEILFKKLNNLIDNGVKNIQCITMSTHSPFPGSQFSNLETPEGMPKAMADYIRSFNALDEQLAKFTNRIDLDTNLSRYTIIITGDHRIFHQEKREKFTDYAINNALDYNVSSPYIPLIIYSPKIDSNIHITDICYQMDIFPTILYLIGCENYYWHGFGVNLMNDYARHNRPTSEEEAFRVSDLMIKSNFFQQFKHKDK